MSKRIIEHPEPKAGDLVGPNYWRGLDEKAKTPEFKKWLNQEFPEGSDQANGFDRRNFLKLMGASFGLAGLGLAGCREPRNHTLPYSKQPEILIPGVPVYYASSFPGARGNTPIIVETHEFRPTKIEGNTAYRGSKGATGAYAQASILDLYDTDRAAGSQNAAGRILSSAEVADALASIAKEAASNAGAGYAFLAGASTSPTRARLVAALKKKLPQAIWAEYSPVDASGADRAVSKLAGKSLRIRADFSKAKRVLALDADFLESGDDSLENARSFAKARRVDDPAQVEARMNRLYAVESTYTLTGASADHRLRASASAIPAVAALIVAELLAKTGGDVSLADTLKSKARGIDVNPVWIAEAVADLAANRGAALIVAGEHLPESVHAIVALANAALGAEGSTLSYVAANDTTEAGIADVTAALEAGKVTTLVVLGGNPAYDAPADVAFEKLAAKARVVRLGFHGPSFDETSALTRANGGLFLAASHYLESWGDGRATDGTYVPVQPMIEPLFPSITEIDVLAAFAGETDGAYEQVKKTFASLGGTNFDAWLAEGLLEGSAYPVAAFSPAVAAVAKVVADASFEAPKLSKDNLELRITPSSHTFDGRYANNGWLVEAPDSMMKTNWENVIVISPKFAKELNVVAEPILLNTVGQLNRNINELVDGVLTARVAKLTLGGRTVEGPLYILPGMPDWTVGVQLGFGRRAVGRVGSRVSEREFENKLVGIGFDVYPLVTTAAPAVATGLKLSLTDKLVKVANTQAHWSMEGRDIIREANAADYAKNEEFAKQMGPEAHAPKVLGQDNAVSPQEAALHQHRGNSAYDHIDHSKPLPNVAVWQGHEAEFPAPQQWGMSIDLNTCTGCNACVIACQAENNIPIVGRDQTLKGRDMRWIRLDRYFFDGRDPHKKNAQGEPMTMDIPEDPQVSFMSVACMHCETAPCESVCPANATVHDAEGLNTMAYNRCIGTRYCANNCPYKVRRFNFLDYNDRKIGHFYEGPMGPGGGTMWGPSKETSDLVKMQKNPNVTVRMRGVMEKCTFCVQRIQEAKIAQKVKAGASGDVRVKDGTLKVACEQVCASESIVFGDVSDPESAVSKAKRSKRDYSVLGFLNTRPRTTYLAKLRNPNKRMPDGLKSPLSLVEYEAKNGKVGGGHGHESHGHEAARGEHAPSHPEHN